MKIRSDFVTNSSSSSFLAIKLDSKVLQKYTGITNFDNQIRKFFQAYDGPEDEFYYFTDDANSVTEYLLHILANDIDIDDYLWDEDDEYDDENEDASENSSKDPWLNIDYAKDGELIAKMDFQHENVEISHSEFEDGGFGPFEYVKIKNGRILRIYVDADCYDEDFKNEKIEGFEFVFADDKNEFKRYEEIVSHIEANGATISDVVTENTRYVLCHKPTKNLLEEMSQKVVPVLSERAFAYRFHNAEEYDIYYVAFDAMDFHMSASDDRRAVYDWFAEYGFGDVSIVKQKEEN